MLSRATGSREASWRSCDARRQRVEVRFAVIREDGAADDSLRTRAEVVGNHDVNATVEQSLAQRLHRISIAETERDDRCRRVRNVDADRAKFLAKLVGQSAERRSPLRVRDHET